ncbi:unnamed protein product [Mycena citricolor]|uniref:Uncharacterized protein n=1 Tax=Mycena citricolor TaxID=2018698 RepID=A0AAD2H195_9AGAR|nr:unnamed protein product [Mycena citricolor]
MTQVAFWPLPPAGVVRRLGGPASRRWRRLRKRGSTMSDSEGGVSAGIRHEKECGKHPPGILCHSWEWRRRGSCGRGTRRRGGLCPDPVWSTCIAATGTNNKCESFRADDCSDCARRLACLHPRTNAKLEIRGPKR